jgi:hypothetical protein
MTVTIFVDVPAGRAFPHASVAAMSEEADEIDEDRMMRAVTLILHRLLELAAS